MMLGCAGFVLLVVVCRAFVDRRVDNENTAVSYCTVMWADFFSGRIERLQPKDLFSYFGGYIAQKSVVFGRHA